MAHGGKRHITGSSSLTIFSTLGDYSGVIRRNATRYLVPGAILLQVSAKPKVRWNAIDSSFGAV